MSKFIKVTDAYGRDVYISEISSIGTDSYGLTEITTPNGAIYSVGEEPSEILTELEKIKSSEIKTLRDEFAMVAMNGILSNPSVDDIGAEGVVHDAYLFADAMLKERSK